jgi:hypothetical protein
MKTMSIGEPTELKNQKIVGKARTMSREEFEQYCTSREFYNWLVDIHGLEGMSAGSLKSICKSNGLGGSYHPWDYDDFARCLRMKMETGITTKEIMKKLAKQIMSGKPWAQNGITWNHFGLILILHCL